MPKKDGDYLVTLDFLEFRTIEVKSFSKDLNQVCGYLDLLDESMKEGFYDTVRWNDGRIRLYAT